MSYLTPPTPVQATVPGLTDDVSKGYTAGSVIIVSSTVPYTTYICTSAALGAATWSTGGASTSVLTDGFMEDVWPYLPSVTDTHNSPAVESPVWS